MKRKRRIRRWDEWTKERSALAHAAKARKRMENPVEYQPRMVKWNRFEITVTDRLTGEKHTLELRSVRDIAKRLSVLIRYS
jgi:hypothetical protein